MEERKQRSVLVFGRGDAEDFKLKGFDIAGKAVATRYPSCVCWRPRWKTRRSSETVHRM